MDNTHKGLIMKIEKELEMSPERVKQDLATIRTWVNLQPHLPTLPDDEETNKWLYNYLFYSKNRAEKVKKHLEFYFTCKSKLPELYGDRDPAGKGIQDNAKVLYLFSLPKLTPKGYRVYFFCHAVPDPSVFHPSDMLRRMLMILDLKMRDDLSAGDILIFYLKYSSLAHYARYNFVTLSRFLTAALNAYPTRIKSVHFMPTPNYVNHILSMPFITDKIKSRIKLHSRENIQELIQDVPLDMLPREIGGTLDVSFHELNDQTNKQLLSQREWFLTNEKLKSDESKRPPEMKGNDMFGSEGTFRTLVID